MFVELTLTNDETIYINTKHIIAIYPSDSKGKTRIECRGVTYAVKENLLAAKNICSDYFKSEKYTY